LERSNVFRVEKPPGALVEAISRPDWFGLAVVLLGCRSASEEIDPLDLNDFGILLGEPFIRDGPVEIFAFFQWKPVFF
jgi:hypothetical protein